MNENGALVEFYWQGKLKYWEKTVSLCHYVCHKCDMDWPRTKVSAVRGLLSHGASVLYCGNAVSSLAKNHYLLLLLCFITYLQRTDKEIYQSVRVLLVPTLCRPQCTADKLVWGSTRKELCAAWTDIGPDISKWKGATCCKFRWICLMLWGGASLTSSVHSFSNKTEMLGSLLECWLFFTGR
jgi:hypothetical protein